MKIQIAASLIFHLTLVSGYILVEPTTSLQEVSRGSDEGLAENSFIEVEVQDSLASIISNSELDYELPDSVHVSGDPSQTHKNLDLKYYSKANTTSDSGSSNFDKNNNNGLPYSTENRMETFEETLETNSFYKYLLNRINNSIAYPDILVKSYIEGDCQIQFEVNDTGVFTGNIYQLICNDDYIKAFTVAILAYSLQRPFPKAYWAKDHLNKTATLFISFKLNASTFVKTEPPPTNYGSRLQLYRVVAVEPQILKAIRKLRRKVPIIIPFGNGVYIDLISVYEFIKNYNRADEDDILPEYRSNQKFKWQRLAKEAQIKSPE